MSSLKKQRKPSVFRKELDLSFKIKKDKELSHEERQEARYKKLNKIFEELGNKENRYLFYCPDIPFANSMVKIIYEYAYMLSCMGYNTMVLHEIQGFNPTWLKGEWVKEVKRGFLSEKNKIKGYSQPTWDFKPNDTIIIPDGFWEVMKGLYENKTLHKVVLCLGYSGLSTIDPGLNWGVVGVTDVICVSEQVKNDYQKIWPAMNYYVVGYEINFEKLIPINKTEQLPIIGLMVRSREDAQQILNLFYANYPFLDLFQFKVMKKLDTEQYYEQLKECALLVLVDEKGGHPAPYIEALAADVPVISVYGRGMSHIQKQDGIIWLPMNDSFAIAEEIASFCLGWLEEIPQTILYKDELLENYKKENVSKRLLNVMESLQEHKIKLFTAVKKAVDDGKLDDNQEI